MRKARILFICLLLLAASFSGCAKEAQDLSKGMFYDAYIEKAVPGEFPIGERISGMAADVCLIEDASSFYLSKIQGGFAGLFSVGYQ